MFVNLLFLIFLLLLLFILSNKISLSLYRSVYLLTKNREFSIGILTTIILPGTIIHELAHFIMATILRVQTGELTIIPKIEENGEIKTGRLMHASSDPFRQILIGLAPMIIGLGIIYTIGRIFSPNLSYILNTQYLILNTIGLYLLFITSLTMFSSKKDLQSLIIAGPITLIVIISLYLIGVRVLFEEPLVNKIKTILTDLNYYLLITAVVNYLVFLVFSGNIFLWQKILKRKIG